MEGLSWISDEWIKFFEVSYDGIIIADGEGRIVYINPASERLEEVDKEYIVGRLASELEEEGIYEVSVTVKTLRERKPVSLMQYKGGKQLVITGIPIFEDDEIKWVYINERDVTELNKIKRDSEEVKAIAEKYKRQLEELQVREDEKSEMVTGSKVMEKTVSLLARIAPTDILVLLEGESGTGKDVHARWIHRHSLRKDKPFVKIDCGTLSETLLESELFGYTKGAFTGASNSGKKGLVEVADGGTLFLDEIGEMPLGLQVKLLRLIQDKVFIPVGSVEEKTVDIRIIAATNRNLKDMIRQGTFRQDLYYRLNVMPVRLPPLRERKEDIFYFIEFFMEKFNKKYGFHKTILNRAISRLCDYSWPGNIRELSNVMERLIVVVPRAAIDASDVETVLGREYRKGQGEDDFSRQTYDEAFEEFERYYLKGMIGVSSSNYELAEKTGLSASTLKRKLKKYKLRLRDRAKTEPKDQN
ncbi:sigma 54-interacting transcriptional regulator [Anaerovorax odorimutans]|uniref:Sigma 54-interacting transcriptional regulator n=1 Tax=Anaerovorax odorimutans TaxID=109327 RepID=A0ABT1RP18_9FIRM|nr:sigma 54-interacting transcriptional regulator [Anaerovorax odorimutans]MCQ4636916.1 sigma 54-interacting transcriptional regulator [Anaerovorax odorimutans]